MNFLKARLNVQPVVLRMLALALATLMAILAVGGIRAIARVDEAASDSAETTPSVQQMAVAPMNEWNAPIDPSAPQSSSPSAAQTVPSNSPSGSSSTVSPAASLSAASGYVPPQQSAPADASNYGDRYATDIYGNPVTNDWLIVLHETVGTADSAIQTFQTPHPNELDQVSYHTLIRRDGTIVYVVPPEKRAYGAGNSVFNSATGPEAVKTDPNFPPSVNNFAYHISLETPPDGHNDYTSHSGYTREQYQSLAWLIARTPVPDDRITTHRLVDQSESRIDPRSFNAQQFFTYLHAYPNRGAS
ncbi:MAG: hypothetical protein Kow00121_26920 [Elainellaceae cyanobacterium]